jgi:hypothetical protein
MTICNSHLPGGTRGHLAGAMRRTAGKLGRSSLILTSLVLAAAITLPRAAFAVPAGTTVGPLPILSPSGGKDPTINFTFNIGGYVGSGTVMATNMGGGIYQAYSGTLTMSTSIGSAGTTYCLVPVASTWVSGTLSTSPSGAFIYDDLVTPGVNPPFPTLAFPTIGGLVFSNTANACGTGFSGTDEINIWAGTPGTYTGTAGQYSFYNYDSSVGGYTVSYSTPAGSTDAFNATVVSTTYAYSGNAFNLFECATSPSPDCSTPGPGNPYGTKNSVTASLQMAAPLAASATDNVLCDANFVSLTLNDGVNTISVNTPCAAGATAWVTTNAAGNITAWYLDAYLPTNTAATGIPVTEDIHTLYDPSPGAIAAACGNCYGSDNAPGEDKGTSAPYYGYVLNSPGTFIPPGQGGATTAGNCTAASPCQLSPIASTVVTVAGNVPFPTNDPIVESSFYIAADPRGPNCGYNGTTGLPTPLLLSKVQVSTGPGAPMMSGSFLGAEVIPWNVCIPPGGAWVDYVIDEQLAAINGLNAYPSFIAPPNSNIVACPNPGGSTAGSGYPYQLIIGSPRKASHNEEQNPENTFTPAIQSCDNGKGAGQPARSVTLFNVQFIQPNPEAKHPIPGTATNQQILVNETAVEYGYLSLALVPLINFQPAQVGKTLEACYVKAERLILKGNYNCAAFQTYQCDQILKNTPVAEVGPSFSVLRLSNPWGDLHSRHLTLGFLLNQAAGNPPVSLDDPNVLTEIPNWGSCPTN